MTPWHETIEAYVRTLAALGGNLPADLCRYVYDGAEQLDIVDLVWGACSGPPLLVLAESETTEAWRERYAPLVQAYLRRCGDRAPALVAVKISQLGDDPADNHAALLTFDRQTRTQTYFDSNHQMTTTADADDAVDIDPSSSSLWRRVRHFLGRPPALIPDYTPRVAPLVAPMQSAFEPPCPDDPDAGCCSLMVLLVLCVCRRFDLADVTAAARACTHVAWHATSDDAARLRRGLWAWQARVTTELVGETATLEHARYLMGLRPNGAVCGVRDGAKAGRPCGERSTAATVYCARHAAQLLASGDDPTTQHRLQLLRRRRASDERWRWRHTVGAWELPPLARAILEADAAMTSVVTVYWHGMDPRPVPGPSSAEPPDWVVILAPLFTGGGFLEALGTHADDLRRMAGGATNVLLQMTTVEPAELAEVVARLRQTLSPTDPLPTLAVFADGSLCALRTTSDAVLQCCGASADTGGLERLRTLDVVCRTGAGTVAVVRVLRGARHGLHRVGPAAGLRARHTRGRPRVSTAEPVPADTAVAVTEALTEATWSMPGDSGDVGWREFNAYLAGFAVEGTRVMAVDHPAHQWTLRVEHNHAQERGVSAAIEAFVRAATPTIIAA